jgi:DNA polymerase-3 subunit gamma/tau
VEPDVLVKHLSKIAAKEGAAVEADGLALIARAAEGSVRDGLSLLDQAIVQAEDGQPVAAEVVRDMLGLADRGQTIALFEQVMKGQAAEALASYRTLYGFGADPAQVVSDLLEHAHAASIGKTLGRDALAMPNEQAQKLTAIGAQATAAGLSRVWQMLLKAFDEVRRAPDPSAAVEMALIRLCYAANLPGPEEALKALQSGAPLPGGGAGSSSGPSPSGGGANLRAISGGSGAAMAQPGLRPVAKAAQRTVLQTFDEVLALIDAKRDVTLKLDVERYVRLVDFKPGVIAFEPAPGAPANLPQRLSGRLKEWTGQPWMMDLQVGGQETSYERERRQDADVRREIEADPFILAIRDAFPGAEIVGVRPIVTSAPPAATDEADDED